MTDPKRLDSGGGARVKTQEHFVDFVSTESTSLFRTALLLSGDPDSAEELLQEVLVRLYPKWDRVSAVKSPTAYVRRSLINRFISGRRGPSQMPFYEPAEIEATRPQADPFDAVVDRSFISTLLGRLNAKQRAAVVMRYFNDMDDTEIADALGCRVSTVRSLISRSVSPGGER
jgi:RNA polymerase sigma-70 factor (sigma-E family)